jgi:erythronate-4-phosphate dehydrogenase
MSSACVAVSPAAARACSPAFEGDGLRILADANIPGLERSFAGHGEIVRFEGRELEPGAVRNDDVLLVRSVTQVGEGLLQGVRPAFVGTATSGTDHLDTACLEAAGVPWAYAPGSNAMSVVEYVLAAIAHSGDLLERLLAGEPIGVIGYGVIGQRLAQCAEQLGIRWLACDPWLTEQYPDQLAPLEEVLQCALVTLHADLHDRQPWPSRHLLGAAELARLPERSLLINAGRGPLVDNKALLDYLCRRPAAEVVLDTWEGEPHVDVELLARCRLGTPHIAGYSYTGKCRATRQLYEAACRTLGWSVMPGADDDDVRQLSVPSSLEGAALVRWLLASVYDIAADDRRMRLHNGEDFDRQRREYPHRLELSSCFIANSDALAPAEQALCAALGCRLPGGD